uniref:WAT1-related protein n=1 Tax=Populus alba TaxID=43335 RepID=A0A4U5R6K4_POPAL|nr:hypothetical protein D5086_0000010660 [Populus alba]
MATASSSYDRAKPFLAVILLQFGYAGMFTITKHALDEGMSQHVLVVYRHAVATIVIAPFAIVFDRKVRPKMTLSIFFKIVLLGLLEPTIDQNLYYTGMKYTTATFTSAMCNVLPAFAFLMAWALRIEQVNIRKMHSQAKIIGTIVTVGGAMLMTLVKGTQLDLPWTRGYDQQASASALTKQDPIKGALMIATGCVCWASFIILQAMILKSYPAKLSLAALMCIMGTVESTILTFAVERANTAVWSVYFDVRLLAAVYGGILSGLAYYIFGLLVKERGPVFMSASNPLSLVMVAILGSFIFKEKFYLGRAIGTIVIILGLYLVLWGKSKDQTTTSNGGSGTPSEQTASAVGNLQASNHDLVASNVNAA